MLASLREPGGRVKPGEVRNAAAPQGLLPTAWSPSRKLLRWRALMGGSAADSFFVTFDLVNSFLQDINELLGMFR